MITQFGITVFGILLYCTGTMASNPTLVLVFGILSMVFYWFLIYTALWDIGVRDKLRIEGKRLAPRPLYGIWVSLCANIPNMLFALCSSFGYLLIDRAVTDAAGNYYSPEWAVNLYGIAHTLGTYLNAMYLGVTETLGISQYPYCLFLIIIPNVIVCFLGYFLGTKELFPIVSEKNNKNNF